MHALCTNPTPQGWKNDSLITAPGDPTVVLGNRAITALNVHCIETISGNAAAVHIMLADNTPNTWIPSGNDSGSVNDGVTTTLTAVAYSSYSKFTLAIHL